MKKNGFTLLEVMLGLAILGFALTVLVKSASVSMQGAFETQNMSLATELSRAKMNDIEEMLLKEGFTDTDQSVGKCGEDKERVKLDSSSSATVNENAEAISKEVDEREQDIRQRWKSGKPFEEEGFPNLAYTYRIEQVELPSWEELQSLAQGTGSGSGSDGGFQNSALGGMMGQLGGGGLGGENIDTAQGGAFIQGQYSLVQNVLKVSIRKVTLCVYYEASGRPTELKTVAYFTDAQAMDKVLQGLGSKDLDEGSGGGGAGGGSGGSGGGGAGGGGGGGGSNGRPGGGGTGGGGTGGGGRPGTTGGGGRPPRGG